jgi:hypothetical protein
MEFDEEFRDCPFNKFVQVSQYGRIKRKDGNILEQFIENGYLKVMDPSGKFQPERVHRLVALTWLNNGYQKGLDVHHKDENKFNNRVDNLEWLTDDEHMRKHDVQEKTEYGAWMWGL